MITAEDFSSMVGTGGLIAEYHPVTEQLAATTDYRYTGANPDNYVTFNNELWRIIGVFEVDDGTGNLEKRMKLIRNSSIGNIAWDLKNSLGVNNWSQAKLMNLLNTGAYWNRTGNYSSTGLMEEAKLMIDDAKWYLGGMGKLYDTNTLPEYLYRDERGTYIYEGNPLSWKGKVALMYPSDYGYATSGGYTSVGTSSMSREECLSNGIASPSEECSRNNWLTLSSLEWTLTPSYRNQYDIISKSGGLMNESASSVRIARPCVYLSSDIKITGGTGTQSDPYTLSR